MSEHINAYCSICGTGYHMCMSCDKGSFRPWRNVVDTVEHYQIYLALHGYTITKNKDKAKEELEKCDLSNKDSFVPEIRIAIDNILKEDIVPVVVEETVNEQPVIESVDEPITVKRKPKKYNKRK